jgi:hypothetical protein
MNFLQTSVLLRSLAISILLSVKVDFARKKRKDKLVKLVTAMRSTFRYQLSQLIGLLLPQFLQIAVGLLKLGNTLFLLFFRSFLAGRGAPFLFGRFDNFVSVLSRRLFLEGYHIGIFEKVVRIGLGNEGD